LAAFEGTRFYEQTDGSSAVFRLEDHLRRLEGSCKILQIDLPYDRDTMREATLEVVRRSGLASGYLRHIVFLGAGAMGLYPKGNPVRTVILTWPWGAYLGAEGLEKGIRAKVSSYTRHHPNAAMLKAKATGNYINSILAKREAIKSGCDEAILLDVHGYVAEGSGENLFMVYDGHLATPPLTSVLSGVTRKTMLQIAEAEGIPSGQRLFTRDEIYLADEVFFCGTAAEVTPVREVDDRPIGDGRPGPITKRLQELFFRIVAGREESWRHWLTPVPGTEKRAVSEMAGATDPVAAT
jgi:branched-chain amino acid aminotransferase